MKFDEACMKAYEYYREEWEVKGLAEILDLGEKWLFYPQSDAPFFGDSHITVSKTDGGIELFMLPDDENFRLLDNGKNLDVPKKYLS